MIKNYYYLTLGILSILFSFSHAWNVQATLLPLIDASSIDHVTKTTIFYVWHIITSENLVFGGAFLVMAFCKDVSKVRFAACVIAIIMVARCLVIFGSTLFKNKDGLMDILTDTIAILIYVGLIILGTRVKDKISV